MKFPCMHSHLATRPLLVLIAIAGLALCSCSKTDSSPASSPAEVDSLVEEIWLDLNEWKPIPLQQWLAQSEANEVDFLTRAEAVRLAGLSQQTHGVELCAIIDDSTPDWTQLLVGKIEGLKDKVAFAAAVASAVPGRKLEIEFGNKWVTICEVD